VPVLGRHNAENALQAVLLCERLGHPLPRIAEALAGFRGIRRRLEVAGRARGVTVIDDYAHNPAKIRAAWETVAPHHRRVIAAWRPHGFAPLAAMRADLRALFAEMVRAGVRLLLLPVFYAGGTATGEVTSDRLAAELAADGAAAEVVPDLEALVERIAAGAREGDAALVMGARDPDLPEAALKIVRALERGA
jgi:UDP-N-acetylmuramate--alanine ligase